MTVAHTNTATKIAKPSIHALDLFSLLAVATSIIIDITAATNSILIVKSSKASQNNSINPFGIDISWRLLPNALLRHSKSSSVLSSPLFVSVFSPSNSASTPPMLSKKSTSSEKWRYWAAEAKRINWFLEIENGSKGLSNLGSSYSFG